MNLRKTRVVGNGDIASVLKDVSRLDTIFFASGVSNSQETRKSEFQRELDLLSMQPPDRQLIYFSTLSTLYANTPYTQHKRAMETVIKAAFPRYCIVRIGNITWGTNPNTLINYLKAHPDAELRDEWRYVVDEDEFLYWIGMIPDWSCEMNIPGKRMKVKEIYDEYVKPHTAKI